MNAMTLADIRDEIENLDGRQVAHVMIEGKYYEIIALATDGEFILGEAS